MIVHHAEGTYDSCLIAPFRTDSGYVNQMTLADDCLGVTVRNKYTPFYNDMPTTWDALEQQWMNASVAAGYHDASYACDDPRSVLVVGSLVTRVDYKKGDRIKEWQVVDIDNKKNMFTITPAFVCGRDMVVFKMKDQYRPMVGHKMIEWEIAINHM